MFRKISRVISILVLFSISFGLMNGSDKVSAFSASITVPSTTTIDVAAVGNSATVSPSNVVVDSTCPLGYTVSISGPADSTLYKGGDNTEASTIPASSGTPANPTSILGNNLGTWGYTTTANATINSNFVGLTNTTNTIFSKNTGSASGGDNISLYYGVSVPLSLSPGNYTLAESSAGAEDNAIVYYLTPTSNCTNVTVRYNDNDANSSTTMGVVHSVLEEDEIQLAASNYQRPGYGFAGWSLVPLNADSATFSTDLATAISNNEVFGPNQFVITDSNFFSHAILIQNELIIYLYAIWVKPETGATLQGWNGCGSLGVGEVVALTDLRDNDVYAVTKLSDGMCWIMENLRLDYDADFTESLSEGFGKGPDDKQEPDTFYNDGYGQFVGLAEPENDHFVFGDETPNSLYYFGTQGGVASINLGRYDGGYRMIRYNNNNTNPNTLINPNTTVSNMTDVDQNVYSYGNYYTWNAAIANPGYYMRYDDDVIGTSICPAGWRLPRGRRTDGYYFPGTFNYLDAQLNMTLKNWLKYPNNFLLAGYYYSNKTGPRGNAFGGYWSGSSSNGQSSVNLTLTSSVVPGNGYNTNYGLSVRCLIAPSYKLVFNANGGSGKMDNQVVEVGTNTNLSPISFVPPTLGSSYQNADGITITGQSGKMWTFWGWNTKADGTGDWYKDLETITDLADSGETITFYAQWKQADMSDMLTATSGTKTIVHNTMQDMTAGICYNSPITTAANAPAVVLTDSRDGTTRSYNVSKLADNNCWMTTNLALGTNTKVVLTSSDTNLTNGTTFTLPAGTTTSSSVYYNPRIRLTNNSGETTKGVYYSWAAAAATSSSTSGVLTTSVCPKNWNLPTNNQFTTLASASAYSASNLTTSAPSSFVVDNAGFTDGDVFYDTSYGHYWTSTSSSSSVAYGARVSSSAITTSATTGTTYGGNKYYEKSVRCIASFGNLTLKYNANNGSGDVASRSIEPNSTVIFESSDLFTAPSQMIFKEWNTNASGTGTKYKAGDSGTFSISQIGQTLELYAIWESAWTITFVNPIDGSTQTKSVSRSSSTSAALSSPYWYRTGYKLVGWDTNSAGTNVVYSNGQSFTPSGNTTLYAVWAPKYDIVYNINTNDSRAAGVMSASSASVSEGDEIMLYAPNFSRPGYGFAGWSFDNSATPGGSSTIYGPNEKIIAPSAPQVGNIKTLYAIWVQSAGSLQNWNGCNSLSTGGVTALTDARDGNTYAVAKLADKNCWIIENLRLSNIDSNNNPVVLSSSNTNNPSLPLTNIYDTSATSNSLSPSSSTIYNVSTAPEGWCFTNSESCVNQSRVNTDNTTNRVDDMTGHDQNVYSYGNYYNLYSATAGNGDYAIASGEVAGDICPKGWSLPSAKASNGSYDNLSANLGAVSRWAMYPTNFVYSGYIYGSADTVPYSRGVNGYYYSSSIYSSRYNYLALVSATSIRTTYSGYKYMGHSARCVLLSSYTITFNSNPESGTGSTKVQNASIGETVTLKPNTFTMYQKVFAGWNTAADGSGTSYTDEQSVSNLANLGENITLYAQWVCGGTGVVCYDGNGASGTTKMGPASYTSSVTLITLRASNYQRPGYGFAGWNTEPDGSGTSYGPNEDISDNATLSIIRNSGITLYAMWIPSAGNLQNWSGCSSLASGAVTALTDTRDNNTYAVAKLADGKCWMIENLRLADKDSDNNSVILSSSNTNNPSLPLTNIYDTGATSNSLSPTSSVAYNASTAPEGWCTTFSVSCLEQSRVRTDNTSDTINNMTGTSQNIYSYGNYYNWYSATAGNGKNSSATVNGDLCPRSWHLPYGGNGTGTKGGNTVGGFYYLGVRLNATTSSSASSKIWRSFPQNIVYSGYANNGTSLNSRGSDAILWTQTYAGTSYANSLYISSSTFNVTSSSNRNYKYHGQAVRCVSN